MTSAREEEMLEAAREGEFVLKVGKDFITW